MKSKIIFGLFIVLGLAVSVSHAQEFTLTTTNANTVSSRSSIDMPGLTGNPLAIIVATPIGNTQLLNTRPIGSCCFFWLAPVREQSLCSMSFERRAAFCSPDSLFACACLHFLLK